MTTKGVWSGALVLGLVLAWSGAASAQTGFCGDVDTCKVATDRPAAVLIYPKIEVDPDAGVDTVVQLTTVSEAPVSVRCSYLNANGHCSNDDSICFADIQCSGFARCEQSWSETDFRITLTRLQPLSWNASQGLTVLPCDFFTGGGVGCLQRNDGRIPPVPEDTFIGELKCIEVDDSDAPLDFNDLIGEATTVRSDGFALDASKYNAIGVQAIPGANDHDNRLCLGGVIETDKCPNAAEYAGCPQTLLMDHFFDGASVGSAGPITSALTLVPCSEDLLNATPAPAITVQFLIFNEFEQRTSTSFRLRCFGHRNLSDIDTVVGSPGDDASSIFSVNTQGTIAGQTRITGVGSSGSANGLVGFLEEFYPCDNGPGGFCTAAVNLHEQGRRALSDVIQVP